MNSYLVALYFVFEAESLPYCMVINACNLDVAEKGICHMARNWWPESEFVGNCGKWFWRFGHVSIEFGEIRLLDELEVSVFENITFFDIWNVVLNDEGIKITDRYDYAWQEE